MKFTHTYTTKWHDTDANRVLRASKILTYFQETANIQCAEFGLPLDELRDREGVGFILSQLSMKVIKPVPAYKKIEVSTWCKEAKGYSFLRFFEMRVDGEVAACASSTWALVDINNKTLVRADRLGDRNFPYDEPIDNPLLPPRARIGKGEVLEKVGERTVFYSDIDYNMHMNNTNYPDMLCDFLPDMQGKYVSEMSLSYLKEAPLGATLTVNRRLREDGFFELRTTNPSGDTCLDAIVKLGEI